MEAATRTLTQHHQLELPLPHRIQGPADYGRALHGRGHRAGAVVTLASKGPEIIRDDRRKSGWKYQWHEKAYPVDVLPDLLPQVVGQEDTFLSMQQFHGWKRIALLAGLHALYVDLDFYRKGKYRGSSANHVLQAAMNALDGRRIPPPSLAISSGQGLYMIWLHSQVPRRALPRWNRCQHELYDALEDFGADSGALDAARVLRIPGTRHRYADVEVEAITPLREVWEFDSLADEILPMSREEYRAEVRALAVKRARKAAGKPQERRVSTGKGLVRAVLWADRLTDVQSLLEWRVFKHPDPDFRQRLLFVAGVAMTYLCVPSAFRRELSTLNRQVGAVPELQLNSKYNPLFRTLRAAAAGERVECPYSGEMVDPRFKYTNAKLVEMLEITPEEELQMQTIISRGESLRRERELVRAKRREAGVKPRAEYRGRAAQRREDALKMASEGRTKKEIAAALDLHPKTVQRYIREGGASLSVRMLGGTPPSSQS